MSERQIGAETARRAQAATKVKLSLRLLASLALLAIVPVAAPPQRRDHKPAPARDARAALLNPRHKFWGERAPAVFRVKFETSRGDFVVEARRDWAPLGADRFYDLARAGFFDDSRFFRVRAGFIAQFGIAGDPAVAAAWRDQAIRDDPRRQSNARGFVTYAMTGANARTTQLFINLADNSRLDREGFAPIGKVIEGMGVVDQLYAGYGEDAGGGMRGGKQGKIFAGGNAYLDREFPKLDRLLRASILKKK
jgi:peptidyl-prolyl cis-trans isomerase A (cyclophilin A)